MVRRHALVLIVALVAGTFAAAQTANVPGTASVSGTVESTAPYNAAWFARSIVDRSERAIHLHRGAGAARVEAGLAAGAGRIARYRSR